MTAMLSQVQGGGQRPGCFPMLSSYNMAPNQYATPGAAAAAAGGIPSYANGGSAAAQQQAMYAYSMMNGGGGGALPNGANPTPVQFVPLTGAANGSGGPMDRLGRGGDVSPTAMRKLSHNAVEVRRRRRISMQLDRLKTMLNRHAARSLSRLGHFHFAPAASCCPPLRPLPSPHALTPPSPSPPSPKADKASLLSEAVERLVLLTKKCHSLESELAVPRANLTNSRPHTPRPCPPPSPPRTRNPDPKPPTPNPPPHQPTPLPTYPAACPAACPSSLPPNPEPEPVAGLQGDPAANRLRCSRVLPRRDGRRGGDG